MRGQSVKNNMRKILQLNQTIDDSDDGSSAEVNDEQDEVERLQDRLVSQVCESEEILSRCYESLELQLNMRASLYEEMAKAKEEIHCLKIMN